MQVLESDMQAFVDCYPPSYPQLKFMISNSLESIEDKRGALFTLRENGNIVGRVMAFIDPRHVSFGRKVGSFGWLNAKRPKYLRHLLSAVEEYFKASGISMIRGPRNDPVIFGGQGVLTYGFNEPDLFGIPKNPIWLAPILMKNGYEPDTQYYCIRWTHPYSRWTVKEDPEISLINMEFDEIRDRADELALVYNRCMANMPDVTGTDKESIIALIRFFKMIRAEDFVFVALCNDKIIGIAVLIPNLFDKWCGRQISNVNWFIADVSKEYRGRFVFSKMKNSVMDLLDRKNIPAYEGTYIWDNNQQMLDMCLRKGKLVRKHVVFTKKLNGGK
ncbi:MAG: hypothetical protein ACTSR3_12880 [Candidatus Helarchaeota archaeon]